jgi:hypothetical protein
MRKREIAALLTAAVLCWPAGSSGLFGRVFRDTSSSSIGVQLAQEGGVGGGYSTRGPIGGSGGGPVRMYRGGGQPGQGSAACSGKSAGEPCSFAGPEGQTVNGTCMTTPNQLMCMPAGGTFRYRTGQPGSQPEGAR